MRIESMNHFSHAVDGPVSSGTSNSSSPGYSGKPNPDSQDAVAVYTNPGPVSSGTSNSSSPEFSGKPNPDSQGGIPMFANPNYNANQALQGQSSGQSFSDPNYAFYWTLAHPGEPMPVPGQPSGQTNTSTPGHS